MPLYVLHNVLHRILQSDYHHPTQLLPDIPRVPPSPYLGVKSLDSIIYVVSIPAKYSI